MSPEYEIRNLAKDVWVIEKKLDNWEEFREEVKRLRERQRSSDRSVSPLLFRGQSRSSWSLATTLERAPGCSAVNFVDYYKHISVMQPELESMTGHEWQIPPYLEVRERVQNYGAFNDELVFGKSPAYDYMAHLRHHGFPSPLLDWSRSAQIASFFAFRHVQQNADKVSLFVLSEASMKFSSSAHSRIHRLGPHIRTHRRHFLQQSEYTMCLKFEQDAWRFAAHESVPPWTGASLDDSQNFEITKFTIPSAERLKVLRELDESNVNAFSLFGSEESLLDTLAFKRFELARASE